MAFFVFCWSIHRRTPDEEAIPDRLANQVPAGFALLMAVALAAGGEVIGVIPEAMIPLEVAHQGLNRLIVVDSMHTRKFQMAELSDAFIALPGGFGTLDEIFEILSWNQLDYITKPAVFLDTEGFWDPMFAQIDVMSDAGLLRPKHRGLAQRARTVAEALDLCAAAPPPTESKK